MHHLIYESKSIERLWSAGPMKTIADNDTQSVKAVLLKDLGPASVPEHFLTLGLVSTRSSSGIVISHPRHESGSPRSSTLMDKTFIRDAAIDIARGDGLLLIHD